MQLFGYVLSEKSSKIVFLVSYTLLSLLLSSLYSSISFNLVFLLIFFYVLPWCCFFHVSFFSFFFSCFGPTSLSLLCTTLPFYGSFNFFTSFLVWFLFSSWSPSFHPSTKLTFSLYSPSLLPCIFYSFFFSDFPGPLFKTCQHLKWNYNNLKYFKNNIKLDIGCMKIWVLGGEDYFWVYKRDMKYSRCKSLDYWHLFPTYRPRSVKFFTYCPFSPIFIKGKGKMTRFQVIQKNIVSWCHFFDLVLLEVIRKSSTMEVYLVRCCGFPLKTGMQSIFQPSGFVNQPPPSSSPSRQTVRDEINLVSRSHLSQPGVSVPRALEGPPGSTEQHHSSFPPPAWPH